MRFFKIELLGDTSKYRENVVVTRDIKGLGLHTYYLREGRRVADIFPSDAATALEDAYPGIRLTSVLSNTIRCLLVDTSTKEIIKRICDKDGVDVEYLHFTIIGHKGFPLTDDYWVVNPLGLYSIVDRTRSEIAYVNDDPTREIIDVKKFVFKNENSAHAPHLFRVPEQPSSYFIDEVLGRAIADSKPTNVYLTKVESV
jgi:hypothetical protein